MGAAAGAALCAGACAGAGAAAFGRLPAAASTTGARGSAAAGAAADAGAARAARPQRLAAAPPAAPRAVPPARARACACGGAAADAAPSCDAVAAAAAVAAAVSAGASRRPARAGGALAGHAAARALRGAAGRRRRGAGGAGRIAAGAALAAVAPAPGRAGASAQAPEECDVIDFVGTDLCDGGPAGGAAAPEGGDGLTDAPSPAELALRAAAFNSRVSLLLLSYLPVFVKSKVADFRQGAAALDDALETEWHEAHREGAADLSGLISELKGFYVKCGQVIATRSDLFPKEYSVEMAHMVDSVNPLPFSIVRQVVERELLGGLPLDEVFERFDPQPLGSASIAQVHRARLRGSSRDVAVKVQRPHVEPRLMSDISVIKNFSYATRGLFPLDYYVVFSELEEQLSEEFDFVAEAAAMDRLADAMARGGRRPAVFIPRSVPGLASKQVLCMDFVPGVPLSQLRAEMKRRGLDIEPGSRAERVFGRQLLQALTEAFAVMIFEEGFFHADPHPGNIFIRPDGSVALIDFGQTKRIGYGFRKQLAELVLRICDNDGVAHGDLPHEDFAAAAKAMGVAFTPTARRECAAALAIWLIDTSRDDLPGGYDSNELSLESPVKDVASFPREFVLVCRTTLLIRGLAKRLGVPWSLSRAWRAAARRLLDEGPAAAGAAAVGATGGVAATAAPALARALGWLQARLGRRRGRPGGPGG